MDPAYDFFGWSPFILGRFTDAENSKRANVDEFPLCIHLVSNEYEQLSSEALEGQSQIWVSQNGSHTNRYSY